MDKRDKKRAAILSALREEDGPMTSAALTEAMANQGFDVSERTVRLYLQEMDAAGLTRNLGKRGREITPAGATELNAARTLERVGFLSAKIDQMTYRMTFDLATRTGMVVVNLSVVSPAQLRSCAPLIRKVFERGYAMGRLLAFLEPGERIGDMTVPPGMVGFCSVCSITLNGVLLKHGVPTHSRFGGLIELRDGKPERFVEMINYDGTSIDPLVIFIRSALTDYTGAVTTGNGRIGASFREIPADSRDLVFHLVEKLEAVGLGGFMRIGHPGRPVLDIPVAQGRAGAIVIGGLNPLAILEESGIRVQSQALAGLLDYNRLIRYEALDTFID